MPRAAMGCVPDSFTGRKNTDRRGRPTGPIRDNLTSFRKTCWIWHRSWWHKTMRTTLFPILFVLMFSTLGAVAQTRPARTTLDIYVIDVEGAKAKHTVVKAGDKISVGGLEVHVVTSAGETIKSPLSGAGGPNPYCANFKAGENNAEDPQSVGIHVTFGKFRTVHLGDLTKNKEFELMCPNNRIGTVDVLLGLHHGQSSSNSEVLVHALHPRVAVMND